MSGDPQSVSELRRALGTFLTGVTVVTTVDESGAYRGLTANSFTSVSLEPPMVLVCIDQAASSHDAFASARGFAVHILGHDQQELATTFAGKSPEKFAGLDCRIGHGGAPLLPDCVTWLDCETQQRFEAGNHLVLFGLVREFHASPRRPLGYCQGSYLTFAPERDMSGANTVAGGWIAETADGRIVLERRADGTGWTIPFSPLTGVTLDDESLAIAARECLGTSAEVQFLYSLYDAPERGEVLAVYRVRIGEPPSYVNREAFTAADMPWAEIPERHTASMLRRYVDERRGAAFGLYAGSSKRGRVAMLHDARADV